MVTGVCRDSVARDNCNTVTLSMYYYCPEKPRKIFSKQTHMILDCVNNDLCTKSVLKFLIQPQCKEQKQKVLGKTNLPTFPIAVVAILTTAKYCM
jgi:hypothetical protein